MKEMTIQKTLDVYPIYDAARVRVQSHVSYAEEQSGMRAFGDITVKGQYQSDDGWHMLNEPIGLDITVQKEKLSGNEPFEVKLAESRYDIVDHYLQIETVMRLYGVKEEEEQPIKTEEEPVETSIVETLSDEPIALPVEAVESMTIREESMQTIEEQADDIDWEAEDLWDDMQMKKERYRLVWLSHPTTYETLAAEYEVDQKVLQAVNRDKALDADTVVFLPMKEKDS